MEIQKIFSDLDGDERLYSVLMNEEEYDLFSELEERMFFNAQEIRKFKADKKAFQTLARQKMVEEVLKDASPVARAIALSSVREMRLTTPQHGRHTLQAAVLKHL